MIGAWASEIVWKICYRSFLVDLGTMKAAAGIIAIKNFSHRGLMGCLENVDLEGGKKSERATEKRS